MLAGGKYMKKSLMKLIISLIIISILGICYNYTCVKAYNWSGELDNTVALEDSSKVSSTLTGLAGTVVTVVRVICMGVAVIMLIVLGIKYMVSAPGDRATIMKHAWVYLVGAFIMFASSAILGIIAKFASSL